MQKAYLVAGLAYGDEGKGASTEWLCRYHQADLVVRYTGGPQATHTVVLPDGREHRFSQFGSGSFLPNVRTHVTEHVLVEPFAMLVEDKFLRGVDVDDALDRITIDPRAVIITPWHWLANRIRETHRGADRHGSCGMGIGECRGMAVSGAPCITVGDLGRPARGILKRIRQHILDRLPPSTEATQPFYSEFLNEDVDALMDFYNEWSRRIQISYMPRLSSRPVIFEGAQGVLLDQEFGMEPYRTWSNTTFQNALDVCKEWDLQPVKLGVVRTYMTRHGAGPLIENGFNFPDHNKENEWQGKFRQGKLDFTFIGKAIEFCGGIDGLIVTHVDHFRLIPSDIANLLWVPPYAWSDGPTHEDFHLA